MRKIRVSARSFGETIQEICKEHLIDITPLAQKCNLHPSTLLDSVNGRIEAVSIYTIKRLADCLGYRNELKLIDKNKNLYSVTFIKEENRSISDNESHDLNDLKHELMQCLDSFNNEELIEAKEILTALKQGKHLDVHKRKDRAIEK